MLRSLMNIEKKRIALKKSMISNLLYLIFLIFVPHFEIYDGKSVPRLSHCYC